MAKNKPMNVRIAVDVTQADIDNGIRAECKKCPVALALTRVLRKREDAKVHFATVNLRNEAYLMPKRARDWIWNFDDTGDVKPFRFRMTLPAVAVLPSVLKRAGL